MNEKILIISPKFYSFEIEIKNYFANNNVEYIFYDEKKLLKSNYLVMFILKLVEITYVLTNNIIFLQLYGELNNYRFNSKKLNLYLIKELDLLSTNKYQDVLIFKGFFFSDLSLNIIKKKCNNLKLFLWDSIILYPKIQRLFKHFTKIYSYDQYDAIKFNIIYMPMFYTSNNIFFDNYVHEINNKYYSVYIAKFSFYRLIYLLKFSFNRKNNYFILLTQVNFKFSLFDTKFIFTTKQVDSDTCNHLYKTSEYLISISDFSVGGWTQRVNEAVINKKKIFVNINYSNFFSNVPNNLFFYSGLNLNSKKISNRKISFPKMLSINCFFQQILFSDE